MIELDRAPEKELQQEVSSEAELVRCAHCGARYEGDVLRELR